MNHLGNASKMVSDTPRVDAVQDELINQDTYTSWFETTKLARQLERELNAANERIKRLEEAGDAIVDYNIGCGCGESGPCRACQMAREEWTLAKEAKP